jgi:hypothetical protein
MSKEIGVSTRVRVCRGLLASRLGVALAVVVVCLVAAPSALAESPATRLQAESLALPNSFSECNQKEACDSYEVIVRNVGSRPTSGTVTLTDPVPAGLEVSGVQFSWWGPGAAAEGREGEQLQSSFCTSNPSEPVQCQLPFEMQPDDFLRLIIDVRVQPGASGALSNTATVSGGGAPEVSTTIQNGIELPATAFGLQGFNNLITGLDGAPATQAGSHPYELTTTIGLNNDERIDPEALFERTSVHDVKDVVVDLPLGVVGSALATPTCTFAQLSFLFHCPADTIVGHIRTEPNGGNASLSSVNSPLYNMVPEQGSPAEFAYYDNDARNPHVLYVSIADTPAGYVLRTTTSDVPQVPLTHIMVSIYGNPSARDGGGTTPVAMFTGPASCTGGPLVSTIHIDSWQDPGSYSADGSPNFSDPAWASATSQSPAVSGCERLQFDPSFSLRPETASADSPSGLQVGIQMPQNEEPESLATPPLRDATVVLPAGLTVNPAAAGGLEACSEAQIGLGSVAPPACPEASRIGTVEVDTPLLSGTLQGSIYLARQNENQFHSLLAGYIVINDPRTGVVIKLPGNLTPDASTGQITAVFDENPQFPVSDLKLHFFGGQRAPLATPEGCGSYTTSSDLMPWSAPGSGPDATPSSGFQIESGCVGGFAPSFAAGSENPQAGAYAPFVLSFSRTDGEQNIAGLTVTLPEGSLGKLAGIPLCPGTNAAAGTCPEASAVGSVTAGAGVGADPYFVSGKVYLTGSYNNGPFGLVEEIPAVAGPFNLGMVVVRQSLRVNPVTAQVTAVSDPLPTILEGIPLRIRRVDVALSRAGFTFNPTSCTPMAVNGSLTSTEGATANVSPRFQVGGCGQLPFKPTFGVSTQATSSKQAGASLDVRVTSDPGQANIGKVAVSLPKQLPSRLSTIQQACPEATYSQNPASCPAGSDIGTATATTPVFVNPLSGPAYLVSHGGAAFPNLVLILQGEGVTLLLTGTIDIKGGITSSAFEAVPDAPIGSFELSLPEGPHSGLAANLPSKAKGSFCGQSLVMPTTLTGQNGAVIKQSTKIAVTGCPKAKPKKKTKPKHKQSKHKKTKGKK